MPAAAQPLPSPRRPAFARNGGAQGHADTGPSLPIRAEAVRTRAHRPPSPRRSRLFPSPFPLVRATPVRAERGVRGQRPIPWCPVRAGRSARGQAIPASPRVAQQGRHGAKGKPAPHLRPAPVAPPSSRAPPPPSFAQTGTQEGHAPAHPCPRTQEGAQRAHRAPWRRRRQPSPTPPTHARGGTARPPSPLRAGDASPATRTSHRTARARKGKGRRIQPLRTGYAGPVFTRPAMPADAGGSGASPGLRPGGGACKGAARKHARTRRVMDRGTVQPGGGERRGVRIGTEVRKGEGDGDGGGVVNEAKRSQGETARANGGHPAPVDRLRKIHVK
ncbi:hypothetical protein EDB85DRAFT_2154911 [Lactarius pseudohatsudake]|nr:hypothetical protein EDB85DRAFT_2154911 [Lactarius pseudohatsudake]